MQADNQHLDEASMHLHGARLDCKEWYWRSDPDRSEGLNPQRTEAPHHSQASLVQTEHSLKRSP